MGNYSSTQISSSTVKNFDPVRYSGEWIEAARYPTLIYEQDCSGAKAIYTWDTDKQLLYVENVCLNAKGNKIRSRKGQARIADKSDPGKLLLRFTDGLPSDPGESPYWVHYTDYDNYALVGGPSGKFLWLLSRSKVIPTKDILDIMKMVKGFGYNPDKLLMNVGTVRSDLKAYLVNGA